MMKTGSRQAATWRHSGGGDGGTAMQPSWLQHTTTDGGGQAIVLRSGTRTLGEISGGALRKRVYGSRHFMRSPAGIAWNVEAISKAEALGCVISVVTDEETGTVYVADLEAFRRFGIRLDYGYGEQIILAFRYWRLQGESERVDPRRDQPKAAQLGLF